MQKGAKLKYAIAVIIHARKGICVKVSVISENRELPACCFPGDAERFYDRSFELLRDLSRKKGLNIQFNGLENGSKDDPLCK
jgi:hypothetical protein